MARGISPELVLVDPELRRHALELLPEREPYEFLQPVSSAPAAAGVAVVLGGTGSKARSRPRPFMSAVAYLAVQTVEFSFVGAAIFAAVVAVTALLSLG
jgi:hypothetical protein